MQSFWIKTTNATNTLGFTNAMRLHTDQSVTTNRLKAPKLNTQKLLRLKLSNGINNDETVLYFNPNALNSVDEFDSQKMFNNIAEIPEIYTQVGSEKLVINGMKEIPENTEIPLGFVSGQANDFSISATEIKNFEQGIQIILKDKLSNTETELNGTTVYNFSSAISSASTDRFSILFRAPGNTTGIINAEKLIAQVYVNTASQLEISAPTDTRVVVYSVVGQKQYEGQMLTNKMIVNESINAGVYIVEMTKGNKSHTQKVIIK